MDAGMKHDRNAVAATEPVVVVMPIFDDSANPLAVDLNFNDASGSQLDEADLPSSTIVFS